MELATIARPYAKAAFEFALQQNKLDFWNELLQNAALIASDKRIKHALLNPKILANDILDIFFEILDKKIDKFGKNFLSLLAKYHRLDVLDEVALLFAKFYVEHKKMVDVHVVSAFKLSAQQKTKLTKVLKKKLQLQIDMHCEVDSDILGGAIIKVRDLVIDGSGRKKLEQLSGFLRRKY